MDRGMLLLALLPLSVFCFDICDFFSSTPPPISSNSLVYHHSNTTNSSSNSLVYHHHSNTTNLTQTVTASLNQTQTASLNQTQIASLSSLNQTKNDTILIKFSSLCSYRGTSMSIKLLVLENFPGINVTLSHHPPARPKYIASKLITTAQVLLIAIVMAGQHIFLELGKPIPSWYYRLTAHKFYVIAIPWLLGCITINYLQNTEGFEIFFNDQLVFCKQQMGRFPGGTEMKEIIRSRLTG